MPFSHEVIAAFPSGGQPDSALIRAMTTRRFAYCLAADEAASDFTAKDPVSSVPPLYLIQNSILFAYDATDSTTTGDGVTCLVTNDACRYKSETIAPPWSVLDKDLTAQPVSPASGDRYLIPTAATGTDWAGKDGKVGIYKGSRWHFAAIPLGRLLYVEDETAFYHRNTSGVWTAGVGSIAIGASSLNITNMLGAKASFVIKVENQTTNAPPVSPVAPTAYVIGPSPTGSWSGNAGKLAICLTAGSFTIITPDAGDTVYDKAQSNTYRYTGSAWVSSAGAWKKYPTPIFTPGTGSMTSVASGSQYAMSQTAPTTASQHRRDDAIITHTADRTGAQLRFRYQAAVDTNLSYVLALYRDSESTAIDWMPSTAATVDSIFGEFGISASNAASHIYQIRIYAHSGNAPTGAFYRRRFTIEEGS